MKRPTTLYKRHRFPPDIIQYAVWLYHRFNLSHRDIEDLLAERGITVSYEAIRLSRSKFGLKYVRRLNAYRMEPRKIVTDNRFLRLRALASWNYAVA